MPLETVPADTFEMDRIVTARLLELGVGPDRVHRNW
jgi:hypothetical protein